MQEITVNVLIHTKQPKSELHWNPNGREFRFQTAFLAFKPNTTSLDWFIAIASLDLDILHLEIGQLSEIWMTRDQTQPDCLNTELVPYWDIQCLNFYQTRGVILLYSEVQKSELQWNAEIQMFGFQPAPKSKRNSLPLPDVQISDFWFVQSFGLSF